MAGTFSAQVAAEVAQIKGAIDGIVMDAAQELLTDASTTVSQGGNMPVQDGFLRNSLSIAINAEPTGPSEKPKGYSDPDRNLAPEIELAIAGFELGDTITARWTANYAQFVEYGARGRPGRAFLRQAAQKWPALVSKYAAIVLSRAGGR